MSDLSLNHLFNADLKTLREYSQCLTQKSVVSIYNEVLISYLTSDIPKLKSLLKTIEHLEGSEHKEILIQMTKLRLTIREKTYNQTILNRTLSLIEKNSSWLGEIHFVAGFFQLKNSNFVKAKIHFKHAYNWYKKENIFRKMALSYHNFIISDANLNISKNTIPDLLFLVDLVKGKSLDDIESLIFLNLSREYQNHNALHVALKYCDQAHQKSLTNHGNLQYWLIIAHKTDLLIELNRVHEAILCLEELHGSSLDEIKEARKLLSQKINSEKPMNIDSEKLHTTWKERYKGDLLRKELPTLGELEQKLIDFIAQGPKDKHEIILHLYEAKGDYYSLENRFKRLISRTRKKVPNLIVFKDGKYTLSDPVFQQKIGS